MKYSAWDNSKCIELSDREAVVCPECGMENTHIEGVSLHDSKDEWRTAWEGRGCCVRVQMSCEDENCHGFFIILAQHKGETYVCTESPSEAKKYKDSEVSFLPSDYVTRI